MYQPGRAIFFAIFRSETTADNLRRGPAADSPELRAVLC